MRQGQRPFRTTLTIHAQTAFDPINIAQFEPGDLSCTQPEPGKQQQDGSIAQSIRRSPLLAFIQKNPHTVGWHRSRNRRHRPSGDGRHCGGKVDMNGVAIPCEAEERAQCRDDVFCRSECAVSRRVSPDIVRNLAGMQRGETKFALAEYVSQKDPYVSGVIFDGRRRQATLFVQIRPVFLQHRINSRRLGRSRGRAFDDAFFPKPARHAGQSDPVATLETAASGAMAQECFFMRGRNPVDRDAFPVQQSTELGDEKCLLTIRNLRVPLIGKILGVELKVRSQRSLDPKPRASLSTCSVHRKHDLGRFLLERTMPTDFFGNVRERKQMHRTLGVVHSAAYDLVLQPYES
jgi:hypothetical protein